MNETLQFLARHGYSVVFVWVFGEQLGLPVPAVPLLLAAGALAGSGQMNLLAVAALAMVAAMASDSLWFQLGRRKGIKVLQLLCRISLEPDSCVRRTEGAFEKHGAKSLLIAKFVPGLNAAAPPLAGIFHMSRARFLLFDALGAALWVGTFIGLGYLFTNQISRVAGQAVRLGGGLLAIVAAAFGGYIVWKFFKRRKFIRELRIARIQPEELKRKLDAGEDIVIVDLRHSMDFEADPETVPGALHMDAAELDDYPHRIPRDREVVLYCT
ncbi:MAG TPA: VTT domain-containing protein [Candidatus Acidoferrales bacterium]|nr:VTT domain-containing protein [Candidatus Acidoferrales bacterium]